MKNLLKDSKSYYENNHYYEIFSEAEDYSGKVKDFLNTFSFNTVLDAGCGTGKFLKILEKKSKQYIGIDLSKEQLSKAKIKSKKDTSIFIQSNLNNISLNDKSVDVIISSWVLGTILDVTDRNKVIDEFKRILTDKGIIILIENAENSEFEYIRGRTKDNRTKDYNNWIINNEFKLIKTIDTEFNFSSMNKAKNCFNEIYGDKTAKLIKSNTIKHIINIYKYENN